jgi:hypothetical protein
VDVELVETDVELTEAELELLDEVVKLLDVGTEELEDVLVEETVALVELTDDVELTELEVVTFNEASYL